MAIFIRKSISFLPSTPIRCLNTVNNVTRNTPRILFSKTNPPPSTILTRRWFRRQQEFGHRIKDDPTKPRGFAKARDIGIGVLLFYAVIDIHSIFHDYFPKPFVKIVDDLWDDFVRKFRKFIKIDK